MSVNLSLKQEFRFGKISEEAYRESMTERNQAWAALTPLQQWASLDSRLGVGVGAKRQRAKLTTLIAKQSEPVTTVPYVPATNVSSGTTSVAKDTPKKKFKKGNKS